MKLQHHPHVHKPKEITREHHKWGRIQLHVTVTERTPKASGLALSICILNPPSSRETESFKAALLQTLSGLRGLLTGTRRSRSVLIEARVMESSPSLSSGNREPLCLILLLTLHVRFPPGLRQTAQSWRANLKFSFQDVEHHYELYCQTFPLMNGLP